jgi:hypothetical protein
MRLLTADEPEDGEDFESAFDEGVAGGLQGFLANEVFAKTDTTEEELGSTRHFSNLIIINFTFLLISYQL